jgi:cytoskeletal protein CcmA (bactofilin family)
MMIGRKEKRSAKNSPTQTGEIRAFLGEGSRFEGVLVFDDIVRMDGHFQGSITSTDTLIAGHTAQIQADIRVGTLILSGYFKGTIEARNKVELRAPAVVDGTIQTPVLVVEEGVVLNSSITMPSDSSVVDAPAVPPE